jgi:hypothetical protein
MAVASAAAAFGQDTAQSQFVPTTSFSAGATLPGMTFTRYSGPGIVNKVEIRSQAVVEARYGDSFLGVLGVQYTLDVTLRAYGYVGDSTSGGVAPVNPFPSLPQHLTTQSYAVSQLGFDTGEVLTTYTDPAAINAFFVGTGTFTYYPAPVVSGFIDQASVFATIGYTDPIRYTTSSGMSVIYYVSIPEPGAGGVLLSVAAAALQRRPGRRSR